jgi:V8-like Glu-specific endopeptidase
MKNNSFKTCIYLLVSLFVLVSCGKNSNDPLQMVNSHIIVGELDWADVTSLRQSSAERRNANKVGKLDIPVIGSRCTAFLISEDVVMTNHHCIPTSSYAQGVVVQFKFEKGVAESAQEEFECDQFIGNNRVLDYALLKCKGNPGRKFGVVELAESEVEAMSSIYIVQQNCDYYMERSCEPIKKISFGRITEIHNEYTHNADTLGGSSGSPVFSGSSDKVVAIHHAGYGNNGLGRGIENYAVPMHKIVDDINESFPGVLEARSGDDDDSPEVPAHTSMARAMEIDDRHTSQQELTSDEQVHFYKLKVSSSGSQYIKIDFDHSLGDLDMELISSSGKVIARSTSTSDTEKIYKYLSRGSYFIKIYGFRGALGNYKLVTF